jgi:hypothetical protein
MKPARVLIVGDSSVSDSNCRGRAGLQPISVNLGASASSEAALAVPQSGMAHGARRREEIDWIHHRDTEAQRKGPFFSVLSASVSLW